MFGAMFSAIPGIIGAIMQGQAQHDQNVMNWEDLQFQKQNAAQQYDLATAGRTDAYGNKMVFDPATNSWKMALTPLSQQLIDAQQNETLKSLTEDAQRARALRERQDVRSQQAGQEYYRTLADYEKNLPASKGSLQDQFGTDALLANQDAIRGAGNDLARMAVRVASTPAQSNAALMGIMNQIAQQKGKSDFGAYASGKQAGTQAYQGEQQASSSRLKNVNDFASLMDDIGGFTPRSTEVPQDMTQMQRDMLTSISQALANQSNQVGSAYSKLASSLGNSVDLSGIANSLSRLGGSFDTMFGGGGTGKPLAASIVSPFSTAGLGLGDRTTSGSTGDTSEADFSSTSNWF